MGPGAKGAPRERERERERATKKKEKKMKRREEKEQKWGEKKRVNETFQIPERGPHPIYPRESISR